MSINFGNGFMMRFAGTVLAAFVLTLAYTGVGIAAEDDDSRTSNSHHVVNGGRSNVGAAIHYDDEHAALVIDGTRDKSQTRAASSKPGAGSTRSESADFDFWIYDVDVQLFNDDDRDGYFHGIDVLFDADTNFSAADVYAVLYLSFEGGPWNEYAVTEDFTIFGANGSDEYVLVTELMSGYPTGSYDLLVELFDAWDGAFLASFGPEDSSAVSFLPLEDFNRDAPVREVVIVESHGGGGSLDAWLVGFLLLLLLGRTLAKTWRHRNDAMMRIDTPAPIWRDVRNSNSR